MFKKTLLAIVIASAISGCAGLMDKASGINDKALKAAEFSICYGASVGSVKRRFNTKELAELWRNLCEENQGFTP